MELTWDYFRSLARDIAETASHPEVVSRMITVRTAPDEERIALATAVYPEELRQAGVPVPGTFRVAPRTFERPEFVGQTGIQRPGLEPGSDADSAWASFGSMPEGAYDTSSWGPEASPLPERPEAREVIRDTVHGAVMAIADFALRGAFHAALMEMYALPEAERPRFVLDVILNPDERRRRGIEVPEGMTIQRSTFYDGRPTLFCISKKEERAYPWRKITVTFDNETDDGRAAWPGNLVPASRAPETRR